MDFAADMDTFLSDFGVDATVGGVPVRGIFDRRPADAFGMVTGNSPTLTCDESDLPAVANGAAVTIGTASYVVSAIRPDGTGVVVLDLETAA